MGTLYSIDITEAPRAIYKELLSCLHEAGLQIEPIDKNSTFVSDRPLSDWHKKFLQTYDSEDKVNIKKVARILQTWKLSRPFQELIETIGSRSCYLTDAHLREEYDSLLEALNDLGFHAVFHNEFLLFSENARIYEHGPHLEMIDEED